MCKKFAPGSAYARSSVLRVVRRLSSAPRTAGRQVGENSVRECEASLWVDLSEKQSCTHVLAKKKSQVWV